MTEISRAPGALRRSPHAVRNVAFSQRRRGYDQDEVRDFLESMANQVESADTERSSLRTENDRLKSEVERLRSARPNGAGAARPEINSQAVALFSQAQQVADRLVAEAVQHARDLMVNARAQQREILQQAHDAAEAAARQTGSFESDDASHGPGQGYGAPVPEIEYVRTFARVAQVQLRSVLDALTEQVDKLGEVPRLNDTHAPPAEHITDSPPNTDVHWQLEAAPPAPRYRSAAQY